jgi:hypothetical protein
MLYRKVKIFKVHQNKKNKEGLGTPCLPEINMNKLYNFLKTYFKRHSDLCANLAIADLPVIVITPTF